MICFFVVVLVCGHARSCGAFCVCSAMHFVVQLSGDCNSQEHFVVPSCPGMHFVVVSVCGHARRCGALCVCSAMHYVVLCMCSAMHFVVQWSGCILLLITLRVFGDAFCCPVVGMHFLHVFGDAFCCPLHVFGDVFSLISHRSVLIHS